MLVAITVMNFINIKSVFAKLGEGSSEIIMYKINIIYCKPLFHYLSYKLLLEGAS